MKFEGHVVPTQPLHARQWGISWAFAAMLACASTTLQPWITITTTNALFDEGEKERREKEGRQRKSRGKK